jgi:hypothetical protein
MILKLAFLCLFPRSLDLEIYVSFLALVIDSHPSSETSILSPLAADSQMNFRIKLIKLKTIYSLSSPFDTSSLPRSILIISRKESTLTY